MLFAWCHLVFCSLLVPILFELLHTPCGDLYYASHFPLAQQLLTTGTLLPAVAVLSER